MNTVFIHTIELKIIKYDQLSHPQFCPHPFHIIWLCALEFHLMLGWMVPMSWLHSPCHSSWLLDHKLTFSPVDCVINIIHFIHPSRHCASLINHSCINLVKSQLKSQLALITFSFILSHFITPFHLWTIHPCIFLLFAKVKAQKKSTKS